MNLNYYKCIFSFNEIYCTILYNLSLVMYYIILSNLSWLLCYNIFLLQNIVHRYICKYHIAWWFILSASDICVIQWFEYCMLGIARNSLILQILQRYPVTLLIASAMLCSLNVAIDVLLQFIFIFNFSILCLLSILSVFYDYQLREKIYWFDVICRNCGWIKINHLVWSCSR